MTLNIDDFQPLTQDDFQQEPQPMADLAASDFQSLSVDDFQPAEQEKPAFQSGQTQYLMSDNKEEEQFKPKKIIKPQEEPSVTASDYGLSYLSGAAKMGENIGYGIEKLGEMLDSKTLTESGQWIRQAGKEATSYWDAKKSPQAIAQAKKQFTVQDAEGNTDWGKTFMNVVNNPSKIGLSVADSITATGLGMGVGGFLTKGFSLIPKVGEGIAAAFGYGLGEGGISAVGGAQQTEEQVMKMTHKQLSTHPEYRSALIETNGDQEAAKKLVARAVAGDSAAFNLLTTTLLSAPMGYVFSPIFANKGNISDSFLRSFTTGVLGEGAQETVQSAAETAGQNLAIQQRADITQKIGEGVVESAVAGGLTGMAMGGTTTTGAELYFKYDANKQTQARQKAMHDYAMSLKWTSLTPEQQAFAESLKGMKFTSLTPEQQQQKADLQNMVWSSMSPDEQAAAFAEEQRIKNIQETFAQILKDFPDVQFINEAIDDIDMQERILKELSATGENLEDIFGKKEETYTDMVNAERVQAKAEEQALKEIDDYFTEQGQKQRTKEKRKSSYPTIDYWDEKQKMERSIGKGDFNTLKKVHEKIRTGANLTKDEADLLNSHIDYYNANMDDFSKDAEFTPKKIGEQKSMFEDMTAEDFNAYVEQQASEPIEIISETTTAQKKEEPITQKPKIEPKQKAKEPRTMDETGSVADNLGGIEAGDVFKTSSGRTTTPFPKAQSQAKINEWQIQNAIAEAESRGDDFNAAQFKGMDPKNFSTSDGDSVSLYLYGEQPKVVPKIIKPLKAEQEVKTEEPKLDTIPKQEETKPKEKEIATADEIESWIGTPLSGIEKDITLQEAVNSRRGISFSPEERGRSIVRSHINEMVQTYEDLKKYADTEEKKAILEDMFASYRDGIVKRKKLMLARDSRVMSVMISGAGNFPVRSNQKKADSAHKAMEDLVKYDDFMTKKIISKLRGTEAIKSTDEDAIQKLEAKLAQLEKNQQMMKDANSILRSKKTDDVKKQMLMDAGWSEKNVDDLLNPDFAGRNGYASFELTNNNAKIKNTKSRIEQLKKVQQKAEEVGSENKTYNWGEVVYDYTDQRIKFMFDGNPKQDIKDVLKKNSLRWSPKNKAWQLQLTANGKWKAQRVIQELNEASTEILSLELPKNALVKPNQIMTPKQRSIAQELQKEADYPAMIILTENNSKEVIGKDKEGRNVTVNEYGIIVQGNGMMAAGMYDPKNHTIYFSKGFNNSFETVRHELSHAMFYHRILNSKVATAKVKDFMEQAKEGLERAGYDAKDYGFKNEHEFISEFESNPKFRRRLYRVRTDRGGNILQQVLKFFRDLFIGKHKLGTDIDAYLNELKQEAVERFGGDLVDMGLFTSLSEQAISMSPQTKYTVDQLRGYLTKQGVSDEEMEWNGLNGYLKDKNIVTKDELLKAIQPPKIDETIFSTNEEKFNMGSKFLENPLIREIFENSRSQEDFITTIENNRDLYKRYSKVDDDWAVMIADDIYKLGTAIDETKYRAYSTKGVGENYREHIYTLESKYKTFTRELFYKYGVDWINKMTEEEQAEKENLEATMGNVFISKHWSPNNVLYHIRLQDVYVDGKKILLLEEIQSDWHQAARQKRKAEVRRLINEEGMAKEEAEKAVPRDYGYQKILTQAEKEELITLTNKMEKMQDDLMSVGDPYYESIRELQSQIDDLWEVIKEASNKAKDITGYEGETYVEIKRKYRMNIIRGKFGFTQDMIDQYDLDDKAMQAIEKVIDLEGKRNKLDKEQSDIMKELDAKKSEYKKKTDYNKKYDDLYKAKDKLTQKTEGIPNAPYAKSEDWSMKAIKNAIAEAVENGYDSVAWVAGKEHADRYSLSQTVDDIKFKKNEDGTYTVSLFSEEAGHVESYENVNATYLSDQLGEELADKIVEQAEEPTTEESIWHHIRGGEIEMGGEGMIGFYDKMLPKSVGKYIKKYGSKVEVSKLSNGQEVWSFEVTPKMQKDVSEYGQYMFGNQAPSVAMRSGFIHLGDVANVPFALTELINKGKNILDDIVSRNVTGKIKNTKIDAWLRKYGASQAGLGLLTRSQEEAFVRMFRKMRADLAKADISAEEKAKMIEDAKGELEDTMFNQASIMYLENPESRAMLSEEFPELAVQLDEVRAYIDSLSLEAMSRGLLLPSQYNKWENRYLSRLYILTNKPTVAAKVQSGIKLYEQKSGRKIDSIIDYLTENPEEAKRLNAVLDIGMMVKQTIAKTQGQIGLEGFLRGITERSEIVSNNHMVVSPYRVANLPTKFSPIYATEYFIPYVQDLIYGLQKEILDSSDLRFIAENQAKIDRYNEIIKQTREAAKDAQEYIDMDANKNKATLPKDKRYGVLAGLPVSKDVASLVISQFQVVNNPEMFVDSMDKAGAKFLTFFKWAKVPGNIFSYPRNFASNAFQWTMSGADPAAFGKEYARAAFDMATKGKWHKIAREAGMLDTNVISEELRDALKIWAEGVEEGGYLKKKALFVMRKLGDSYGIIDDVAKVARLRYAVEQQGKSIEEAVEIAQNAHFDYSLTYDLIRAMRNPDFTRGGIVKILGTLFPTYTHKTIAYVYDTIINRPVTFGLLNAALYMFMHGDDDDMKKEIGAKDYQETLDKLPNWFKYNPFAKISMHRLDDGTIDVEVTDLAYVIPYGTLYTAAANVAGGLVGGDIERVGTGLGAIGLGGSPIMMLGDYMSNKDTFTGKDIYFKYDTFQWAKDTGMYAFKQLAPGTLTKVYSLLQTRHPIIPRLFGINTYIYNNTDLADMRENEAKQAIIAASKRKGEYKRKITDAREQYRRGQLDKNERDEIIEKNEDKVEYWTKLGEEASNKISSKSDEFKAYNSLAKRIRSKSLEYNKLKKQAQQDKKYAEQFFEFKGDKENMKMIQQKSIINATERKLKEIKDRRTKLMASSLPEDEKKKASQNLDEREKFLYNKAVNLIEGGK